MKESYKFNNKFKQINRFAHLIVLKSYHFHLLYIDS